jgi:hypothetical protein
MGWTPPALIRLGLSGLTGRGPDKPGRQVGRPSSAQATKPPIMSVARASPSSCSAAAARLEVYPSEQNTMTRWSYPLTQGSRASLAGSNRHSRTFRSTMTAPGMPPSRARWACGRMSTSTAPRENSPNACRGVSRRRRPRAAARTSSIVRAPGGRPAAVAPLAIATPPATVALSAIVARPVTTGPRSRRPAPSVPAR